MLDQVTCPNLHQTFMVGHQLPIRLPIKIGTTWLVSILMINMDWELPIS